MISNDSLPLQSVYSVSSLNREIHALVESSYRSIQVKGEISNLSRPASGHLYFSLKDAHAQVRCAFFKSKNMSIYQRIDDGMEVIVRASAGIYEKLGSYQLVVESLEPVGEGALLLQFEKLKRKLEVEGLFDPLRKRLLPTMPAAIGVITSPSGAALHDIKTVLLRRYPLGKIIIYPVLVQGEKAAEGIIAMLECVAQRNECDVVILARGGGSLEDLQAFNNEQLARAIAKFEIPLVSAIGHETDFTIADFVADIRGATPSVAAELVSPDQIALQKKIAVLLERLVSTMQRGLAFHQSRWRTVFDRLLRLDLRINQLQQTVDYYCIRLSKRIPSHISRRRGEITLLQQRLDACSPLKRLQQHWYTYRRLDAQLMQALPTKLATCQNELAVLSHRLEMQTPQTSKHREKLSALSRQLEHAIQLKIVARLRQFNATMALLMSLSPKSVLSRGYSIVRSKQSKTLLTGAIIRRADQLAQGDRLAIQFDVGEAEAKVEQVLSKKTSDSV